MKLGVYDMTSSYYINWNVVDVVVVSKLFTVCIVLQTVFVLVNTITVIYKACIESILFINIVIMKHSVQIFYLA